MQVRAVVSYASMGVFIALILLEFLLPAISTYVLFGLAGWLIASLFLYRLPVMSRTIGKGAAPGAPAPAPLRSGRPLPGATLPSGLDFCLYCAGPVERGTPVCPQCGRTLPPG